MFHELQRRRWLRLRPIDLIRHRLRSVLCIGYSQAKTQFGRECLGIWLAKFKIAR